MESKINPNDPAYPINIPEGHTLVNGIPGNGLTKREYFAGLAMQAVAKVTSYNGRLQYDHAAELSVAMADALIEQLNKPVTP